MRFNPSNKEFYLFSQGSTEKIKLTEYQKQALLSKGLEWLKGELKVDIKTPADLLQANLISFVEDNKMYISNEAAHQLLDKSKS